MATDDIVKIMLAIIALMIGVIGPISWATKAVFAYQNDRIKILETREQTVLTSLVDTVENMGESVKITGDFSVKLMEDLRYRERRENETGGRT